MVANLDCHLDWAQRCLGDQLKTHLEVSVKDFSEKMDVRKINYAVETHSACSQHYSVCWGPRAKSSCLQFVKYPPTGSQVNARTPTGDAI